MDNVPRSGLAWSDFFTLTVVEFLGAGKFYSMFSVLFGIGFYIQAERAQARGKVLWYLYLRRSIGLFLIAWIGISCGLWVDILNSYAIFGLTLLLFYRRTPRFILVSASVCFAATMSMSIYLDIQNSLVTNENDVSVLPVMVSVDDGARVFQKGTFFEIGKARATDNWSSYFNWQTWLNFEVVGLLLVGLYIGRKGAVDNAGVRKAMARRAVSWLLGIGFTACLLSLVLVHSESDDSTLTRTIVRNLAAWPIGQPVLSLGYMALLTLLLEREWWRRTLLPLAAVGRTALTNYIFTNLILAVVCYPWGFGRYGDLLPTQGLMVAFVVFLLQLAVSRWWLSRFTFGPAEWAWRSLTYGKIPVRRDVVAVES